MIKEIRVKATAHGLHEITDQVAAAVRESGVDNGLCTVFICHTSASLAVQENADPSARRDLENWLSRLVAENDPLFTHTMEGADDMPSHIKSALTCTSLSIPLMEGRMVLGTWQGIYLWEHRRNPGTRRIIIHVGA